MPPASPPAAYALVVGTQATLFFDITGGSSTYNVAVTSGAAPAGLVPVDSEPQLKGVLTTPGTYSFTLTVTDTSNPAQTATQQFSNVVVALQPLVLSTTSLNGGIVNTAYSTSLYAQGGIPPYTWKVTQGSLPPGLTNTVSTPAIGAGTPPSEITGTPTASGTFSFTLQVQDSSATPLTATQTFALSVINPTPFTDPSPTGQPFGITNGPGGSLVITQQGQVATGSLGAPVYGVESLATSGAFSGETQLTNQVISAGGTLVYPGPQDITLGPDNNLWATDNADGYLLQVKNGAPGAVVRLQNSGAFVAPTGIVSGGSVGGVWFTGIQGSTPGTGLIGEIDPANPSAAPVYLTVPQPTSYPTSIIQNPKDGNALWFLDQGGSTTDLTQALILIGRVAVSGGTPAFQAPAGCQATNQTFGYPTLQECILAGTQGHVGGPYYGNAPIGPLMQVDSTGTVWFATKDQIGSISMDGSTVALYPLPVTDATFVVTSIALGSDSAIWYVAHSPANNLSLLGRVSTSGVVTQFPYSNSASDDLQAIITGADGALWVTDPAANKVLQIFPSLALSCNVPQTLEVGTAISGASCSAFGGKPPYSYSFNTSNLPPGVSVSSAGVLSGTPTAPGTFTITASDSSSPAQQATQVISIQAVSSIQLQCAFPTTASAGQSYSGSCTTAGGNPPYTYKLSQPLPGGLTGTATAPASGSTLYTYNVTGTLSFSDYGTQTFTITAVDSSMNMSPPQTVTVTITPVPLGLSCNANVEAIAGQPFLQTCFGTGGAPPYSFAATGLPSGLTINTATGIISGTPATAAQSTVSLTLNDSSGQNASETLNFSVINSKLALVCDFSASLVTGAPFSTACKTYGGTGPFAYSVLAGTLPAGLTLSASTGAVTGSPTTAGPVTFTLQVTDSEAPAASARQTVSVLVNPTALTILTASLPTPNSALPYAALPIAAGGTPPYSYSISAGALPSGLQQDTSTGAITSVSGGTLATGAYSFTVQVTDAASATATQTYSGTISAALVQNFTSYALPNASGANGITAGPDGAMWFTTLDQTGGNLIGRITTGGVITTTAAANALTTTNLSSFELATGGDITTGPDGELWVAQRDGNAVGEVAADLSSQLSFIPATASSGPAQLTAAPDGAVWFTEGAASQIAHVDAHGNLIEIPTPTPSSAPAGITVGSTNLIVFTEPAANKIGILSEDGTVKADFSIPTSNSLPTGIVEGPDNAFWFTEYGAQKIGRIDLKGNISEVPVSSAPQSITVGPDGALYFTEPTANKIGRLTIFGVLTEIPISDANSGATGIATGPDGSIWFTESNLSKIGRLSFILGPTVTCTLPASPLQNGSAFSGSCTATQGTPPYTFSATGNPPPGVSLEASTGALSGTLTTAGTFTFAIVVTDSSSPQETGQTTYTFAVSPTPLAITCSNPTAYLYTTYSGSCSASGTGTPPYTFSITSGSLPAGLSLDPTSGGITGTPTALGSSTITVQATDSSVPVMTATQTSTLTVQYGSVTSGGGSLFTLSNPPNSVDPGAAASGLTLTANQTLTEAVSATATLTFKQSDLLMNTPASYVDPAMQFVDSSGNGTGLTYNFTIPAGTTTVNIPAFNVGTVAGTIDLTITANGVTEATTSLVVPPATPVIEAGSVQFTNVTSTGFDLELVATSATRSASTVAITINPASGDTIVGQSTFVIDVSKISADWFSSSAGQQYGGRFSLTIPFVFSGPINAISSATVTFSATAGNPSAPVTGNR